LSSDDRPERPRGVETRIIAGEVLPAPDAVLQRSLAEVHDWARALRAGTSLTEITRETGRSESYIRTSFPLAFLAPKLQAAILDGRQPADLWGEASLAGERRAKSRKQGGNSF
jgi:hypothetical protein